MRFTTINSICTLLILFSACSSDRHGNQGENVIQFSEAYSGLKNSDLFQQVEVIKPISSNGPRIQYDLTKKILGIDNLLLLVHQGRGKDFVYCFDQNGNNLYNLDKKGEGPFEYTEISNVFLDKEKNKIVLQDRKSRKLIHFNLEGEPIEEVSDFKKWLFHDVGVIGDRLLGINGATKELEANILIVNQTGQLLDTLLAYDESVDHFMFGAMNPISVHESSPVLFLAGLRDTIFSFDKGSNRIDPGYVLDFENASNFDLSEPNVDKMMEFMINHPKHRYLMSNLFQNKDWIVFTYFEGVAIKQAAIHKTSQKLILISELENDLLGVDLGFIRGVTDDGKFIAPVPPDRSIFQNGLFQNSSLNHQHKTAPENISDPDDPIWLVFDLNEKVLD